MTHLAMTRAAVTRHAMTRRALRTATCGAAAFAILAPFTAAAATATAAPAPAVKISAALFDSPGVDTGSNASLNAEYVVVKNVSRANQNLSRWTVKDKNGFTYTFPVNFVLKPGAAVTIHTGKGVGSATHQYFNKTWYVWNNTGDTAYLRTASGALVHSVTAAGGTVRTF